MESVPVRSVYFHCAFALFDDDHSHAKEFLSHVCLSFPSIVRVSPTAVTTGIAVAYNIFMQLHESSLSPPSGLQNDSVHGGERSARGVY